MVLTEECHNHCVFCDTAHLGAGRHLPRRLALDQIAHYAENKVHELVISGGEPLHHPDLLEVVAAARNVGVARISLYTTACFELTSYTASALEDAGIDCVMVSMFGAEPRVHDAIARSRGAYNQTLRGLDALSRTNIQLTANTPIMRANIDQLDDILRILATRRVSAWQLSDMHPTTAVVSNVNVHLPYDEIAPAISKAVEGGAKHGIDVVMQEFPLCVLGSNFRRSQELQRAWYTALITEEEFRSGKFVTVPPISAPGRTYLDGCQECSLMPYCRGVPTPYMQRYPAFGVTPIHETNARHVARISGETWLRNNRMIGLMAR